jgi:flagellar basal body-associated protein FliL
MSEDPGQTERPRRNRKLWWIIGLVALLVLVGIGLLVYWWYSDQLLRYD